MQPGASPLQQVHVETVASLLQGAFLFLLDRGGSAGAKTITPSAARNLDSIVEASWG